MSSNLRQRSVVSSYICTHPLSSEGFKFALFKRSQDVSTYRGKWAVCSGSIDPKDKSPESAAKREILEETTLSDEDISLLRRGKPFRLTDEGLKTEWTIHPFAWELKTGAKSIKFDWEHTEYRFIKPEDLESYDHVPQLELGLGRVTVSTETERALAVLKDDHESGAQGLALKALDLLLEMVKGDELSQLKRSDEFWREVRWRAWHLAKNGRPSMGASIEAALFKALDASAKELSVNGAEGADKVPLSKLKSTVESAIESRITTMQHRLDSLAQKFVQFVEQDLKAEEGGNSKPSINIVTLSASGTITRSLSSLIRNSAKNGVDIKLLVLESRPKFEGVALINTLLSSFNQDSEIQPFLKVEIFSDASIASVIQDAQYLIFGGDKVLPNGSVSNKIGSLAAAALAKSLNPECKVVAVYETDKIVGSSFEADHHKVEFNDEEEVIGSWPRSGAAGIKNKRKEGWVVEIKNAYFEWVPEKLIDVHISEQGLLNKEDILKLGNQTGELEERLFEDL
ncbi:Nagb transferase-like protein [Venustampulla echinocandica]|uniref:Nagb transferase-like protein n=1 Tax=Venustampulla echinocandica TaxID=2656787 RepID=A0A370U0W5_9HELO|nr:Nagb transferase-like protein [Venustampulla echinocandica]RDL41429.1 Nagb transferase-like protein [Venustampulla echinocandica]